MPASPSQKPGGTLTAPRAPERPRTITQAESWNVLASRMSEWNLEADKGSSFAFVPISDIAKAEQASRLEKL